MTVSPIRELLPGRKVGVSAPPGPAQGAGACARFAGRGDGGDDPGA
jgi:hypothetical protein